MKKITKKNYAYALMLVLMASCTKSEDLLMPKSEAEHPSQMEQNAFKTSIDTPYRAIDTPYRKVNFTYKSIDTPYKAIDTPYREINITYKTVDTAYIAIDTPYRYTHK